MPRPIGSGRGPGYGRRAGHGTGRGRHAGRGPGRGLGRLPPYSPRRRNLDRCVGFDPTATFFKPRGIPLPELETVELRLDELEAMRLCDQEGQEQAKAAKSMGVSQSTLQRTLTAARHKVADALVGGKAIEIIE